MDSQAIVGSKALRLLLRSSACRKRQQKAVIIRRDRNWACPPERSAGRALHSSQRNVATNAAPGNELYVVADALATLKTFTSVGAAVGILTALTWSSLPLLATPPDKEPPATSDEEEDEAGIKWGLMSVVSCLPLFNWLVRLIFTLTSCCHICLWKDQLE